MQNDKAAFVGLRFFVTSCLKKAPTPAHVHAAEKPSGLDKSGTLPDQPLNCRQQDYEDQGEWLAPEFLWNRLQDGDGAVGDFFADFFALERSDDSSFGA